MRDVIECCDDAVRVRWSKPRCNGGASITGYELQWRCWGAQNWKSAKNLITGTECRKKNLLPGKRYEFRVRGNNSIGYGPYSVGVSGSTTNVSSGGNGGHGGGRGGDQEEEERRREKKEEKRRKKKKKKEEKKKKSGVGEEKKKKRPRPSGPPPPPKSSPPTFNPAQAPTAAQESACNTPASYPGVELWYRMVDDIGSEYWWSESSGSVWDGPTWIDRWDENHNAHYYEHRTNGHTTWRKPNDFVPIVPGS
jgi:hypothetical protein